MVVFLLTTPSVKAARAVTSLMVEHGTNPVLSANFWLTILRMRPLVGSTTTTLPAKVPRAATAARRMTRSSPSTLSPMVGSTPGTLRKDLSVTSAYVGTLSHHLPFTVDKNYAGWTPGATTANLPNRRPYLPGT